MHLVRVTRKRKYCPNKMYLYIRYKQFDSRIIDYPLGRMDRREPELITRYWLEDSDNLPELFRIYYTLRFCDVKELHDAIITGLPWGKWDRIALTDKPQNWKCKVVNGKVIIPEELQQEKTYKKRVEEFINKVMADKLRDKLRFGDIDIYNFPIPNAKEIR